jgi:hypothetical protein
MAVRRVGGSVEKQPRLKSGPAGRSRKAPYGQISLDLVAPQTEDVVTKTVWESIRAVALALAVVAVPLLLLHLKFVKDMSGFGAMLGIIYGSGWVGITVASRMKGFHFWSRAIVCVVLILGIAVIAFFMADNMRHYLESSGSDE